MLRSLVLSDKAKAELGAAKRWLRQPGAGIRAAARLRRIAEALSDLRRHPCRWPESEHRGVRERSIEGYRILYEVTPDTGRDATAGDVHVLRVFGPHQDRSDI
ncbi:type II toxin-antitoxin system RelE/ParE family toxin [Phenylobacterium sp.]|uniref:type II toxin-antitoxin system RelE/ParE family toxin n=1 Tax=Phenylobacterium sp. TaxID=1871053 RepID=UPI0025D168A2|nr:type II toxin-antitoxin system RelE/ParE family toxin [Phenylobacterium sp.]MBX3483523.1 type II toxin-antitoxin system RelE/ParE family toxin [Phenylobacterium sp.]MCW5760705.1 type II toxin-antitoxin system RelE/ParE family toxin [Phenylobacterium sp.]